MQVLYKLFILKKSYFTVRTTYTTYITVCMPYIVWEAQTCTANAPTCTVQYELKTSTCQPSHCGGGGGAAGIAPGIACPIPPELWSIECEWCPNKMNTQKCKVTKYTTKISLANG